MHFSSIHQAGGSRFGKLAIVAALHVAIGAVFIHTLNTRGVALPAMPAELVLMLTPEPPPPPPPPPPTVPTPATLAPPQVIAPPVEVLVQQAPPPNNISVEVSTATAPQPPTTAAVAAEPGPATAAPRPAGVRSVALADASGCATPNYPARAARNNESGTVILALLVGTNGRVGDARIDSTSGSRELDKAAIAALSTCTFKPAMNGGVAEPGWARIAYVWTLEQ
ncbi:energy transducer TonB [Massilia sp. DWR3-1-1]|uniref:energy transducer TonB n=1 Tax=Massilia sp. DWR3-1-1 TaxID=2804559 RepID=UPI003CED7D7C